MWTKQRGGAGNYYLAQQRLGPEPIDGVERGAPFVLELEPGNPEGGKWGARWARVNGGVWVVALDADPTIPGTSAPNPDWNGDPEAVRAGLALDAAEAARTRTDPGPLYVLRRWHEAGGDRYRFDFETCTYANGWAQIDTADDAAYLGHWLHLDALRMVSYVEGDVSIAWAPDAENLAELIREMRPYYGWVKIDPGLEPGARDRLEAAGFGDLLHEQTEGGE